MRPRHGTNHWVPAGAGVKHAMRICAESEEGGVGEVGGVEVSGGSVE